MELSGVVPPNPGNQRWPEPTPYTLSHQQGVKIIQQKDQVLLIYLRDQKVRHVRMNVAHSEYPAPTWQGESVGHYEGDTLLIDTIGQKVGPPDSYRGESLRLDHPRRSLACLSSF